MNLKKMKLAVLTTMVAASGTVFSSCSLADVKKSLYAGTLNFINGYATTFWTTVVPPPSEYLGDD